MAMTGTSSGTVKTDTSGNYTFPGLANGTYTVTPSLSGYTFNPVSEAVKISGDNVTSINFTATANSSPTYNISGTVTSSGKALPGVTVTLSGNGLGTASTDSSGNYTFTGLTNGSYTVASLLAGYTLNPTSIAVLINGANSTSNNFISSTYSVGTHPMDIAIDGSGNVWVVNQGSNNVTKLSSSGTVLGTYSVGSAPKSVAIDGSGNVWVANMDSGSVTELSSSGTFLGTYSVKGYDPDGIAIDGSGNVWVANINSNGSVGYVTKLSSSGSFLGTYSVGTNPDGIAIDGSGNVWVANSGSNNVTKLSSAEVVLGTYTVSSPVGIAIDSWVTTGFDGTPSTAGVVVVSGFSAMGSIGIDGAGNVWVANPNGNTVTESSPSSTVLRTYTYPASTYPTAVAIDGSGNVWIANQGSNNVTELLGVASPVKTPLVLQPK
jgi:streptogramin lyase